MTHGVISKVRKLLPTHKTKGNDFIQFFKNLVKWLSIITMQWDEFFFEGAFAIWPISDNPTFMRLSSRSHAIYEVE